jgi:hypothetical protein
MQTGLWWVWQTLVPVAVKTRHDHAGGLQPLQTMTASSHQYRLRWTHSTVWLYSPPSQQRSFPWWFPHRTLLGSSSGWRERLGAQRAPRGLTYRGAASSRPSNTRTCNKSRPWDVHTHTPPATRAGVQLASLRCAHTHHLQMQPMTSDTPANRALNPNTSSYGTLLNFLFQYWKAHVSNCLVVLRLERNLEIVSLS